MSELDAWDSFYVIVGPAAGALIGLQFVVVTLIAERPSLRIAEAGAAFATPSIVHFGAVLLLSALTRAPWDAISPLASLLAVLGVAGLGYEIAVARYMRRQTVYEPDSEDWVYYLLLPTAGYAILLGSGIAAVTPFAREALFGVGAAALLLLFVGIRNTWDSVVYHVFVKRDADADKP